MTDQTGIRAHRFSVGAIECAIVSDGTFAYHEPAPIMFSNAPPAERDRALRAHGIEPDGWHEYVSPYSALLIETADRRVLVDTGAGGFAPTNGRLHNNLRAEGADLPSIDTVITTHAHPDHIGGNLDTEQRPAFPNARYVLWHDEWDFWTKSLDVSNLPLPDALKELLINSARDNLPPIERQVELLERDTEVAPGVRVIAAPGHTPGHVVVSVDSGGEQLLWTGDLMLTPGQHHASGVVRGRRSVPRAGYREPSAPPGTGSGRGHAAPCRSLPVARARLCCPPGRCVPLATHLTRSNRGRQFSGRSAGPSRPHADSRKGRYR